MLSFYQANLTVFAAVNILLLYRQHVNRRRRAHEDDPKDATNHSDESQQLLRPPAELKSVSRRFQVEYFSVYVFAVAADWLQGPHIYAMYKYSKGLPEQTVAALYATGFISGAVSAFFAGELADRLGRRLACLVYCLAYIMTCISMLSGDLLVLFAGRVCGGIATTLLYSAFEAWLVTEYHQRNLAKYPHLRLGDIFGTMTRLSSVVAIASGVVGDVLVGKLDGGRIWPFLAGAACATIAALLMLKLWPENYGYRRQSREGGNDATSRTTETRETDRSMGSGVRKILGDKQIWGLGLTSTFFEGTMYLFVFFWSAALKSARDHGRHAPEGGQGYQGGGESELPFGIIFSSFMCAMMAGSTLFSLAAAPAHTRDSTARVLMAVVLAVACSLSAATLVVDNERVLFWIMCVVELCIGAYFPSMSFLKSEVVEDGVRGRVYSVLRLPLNVFVVVAHALDSEGDGHRNGVFLTCAALLAGSVFVVKQCFL